MFAEIRLLMIQAVFSPKDIFESTSATFHSLHGIPQSPWPNKEQAFIKTNSAEKTWSSFSLKHEAGQGPGGQGKVLKIQLPVSFPKKVCFECL